MLLAVFCFPPGIRQRLDIKGLSGQPELASACDTSSLVITLLLAALGVGGRKMPCAPTKAKVSFQMQRYHPGLICPPSSAYSETREGAQGAAPRTGPQAPGAQPGGSGRPQLSAGLPRSCAAPEPIHHRGPSAGSFPASRPPSRPEPGLDAPLPHSPRYLSTSG